MWLIRICLLSMRVLVMSEVSCLVRERSKPPCVFDGKTCGKSLCCYVTTFGRSNTFCGYVITFGG